MENKNVLVNRLLITLVITVITFCSSTMCKAQYLINQTYMKPMPTFTTSKQHVHSILITGQCSKEQNTQPFQMVVPLPPLCMVLSIIPMETDLCLLL